MRRIQLSILFFLLLAATVLGRMKSPQPLSDADFQVCYNSVVFGVGDDAQEVLAKLGLGIANPENNYGFIGQDDENRYKFYYYGYPADSSIVYITTRVEIGTGKSIVSHIDASLVGTNRGLRKGDSYERIAALYGWVSGIAKKGSSYRFFLDFKDKTIEIEVNDKKTIESIDIYIL